MFLYVAGTISVKIKVGREADPDMLILGIHTKKSTSSEYMYTAISMPTVALSIPNISNQLRCLTTDKCTGKAWYICVVELKSNMKDLGDLQENG